MEGNRYTEKRKGEEGKGGRKEKGRERGRHRGEKEGREEGEDGVKRGKKNEGESLALVTLLCLSLLS